jgi:hypothetical protein
VLVDDAAERVAKLVQVRVYSGLVKPLTELE